MKYKNILATYFIISLSCITLNAQDITAVPDAEITKSKVAMLNSRFSNLPLEKRKKYLELKNDANRYFSNKRTFETLMTLHEMKTIFADDPSAYNLLGAIYVEFRDFKKAREIFQQAIDLAGNDPSMLFNLAELEFCDKQWHASLALFSTLLKEMKGQTGSDLAKISELKILLSYLALSKTDDSAVTDEQKKDHLAQANKMRDKYGYLIDSPYYYYANAALEFYKDDRAAGSNWILTAKRVYVNSPGLLTSWDDTLIEFGYIDSHYGGNHSISTIDREEK